MKESFNPRDSFESLDSGESVERVMEPPEGPLQELLPIHFTTDQVEAITHILTEHGFTMDTIPPMDEVTARDILIPLLTEYFETSHPDSKEVREEAIIQALSNI